jgi:hypothetical protein
MDQDQTLICLGKVRGWVFYSAIQPMQLLPGRFKAVREIYPDCGMAAGDDMGNLPSRNIQGKLATNVSTLA